MTSLDLLTAGVSLPLSGRWTPQEGDDPSARVALPALWPKDSGFAPTLTVLGQPVDEDVTIRGLVTAAMAAAMEIGYLVSDELWTPADGAEGREVTFGYVFEGVGVIATQWLLVHAGRAVTITLTAPGWAWSRWVGDVLDSLSGLALYAPHESGLPSVGRSELPEPAHDPEMGELGEIVEDLSRVGPTQPRTDAGTVLPADSLAVLAAVGRGEAVRRDDPAVSALIAAEVLEHSTLPTEDGRRVLEVLGSEELHIRCETSGGGVGGTLDAWVMGGQAVIVASGADRLEATVQLHQVPAGYLPVELARWLGIGPRWTRDFSPKSLPQPVVMARVDDPETPVPAGSDASMVAMWGVPWLLWTAQREDPHSHSGVIAITVGDRALLTPSTNGETFELSPTTPSMAFWHLAGLLD